MDGVEFVEGGGGSRWGSSGLLLSGPKMYFTRWETVLEYEDDEAGMILVSAVKMR